MAKKYTVSINRPDSEIDALKELFKECDLGSNPTISDIVNFAITVSYSNLIGEVDMAYHSNIYGRAIQFVVGVLKHEMPDKRVIVNNVDKGARIVYMNIGDNNYAIEIDSGIDMDVMLEAFDKAIPKKITQTRH